MNRHLYRKIARLIAPAVVLTAGLTLPSTALAARPADVFAVDGYLQDNGGQCRELRDHAGRLYVLEGRTEGLRRGDHVRLVARAAYGSRCREYGATNVVVTEVVRVWSDVHHTRTHYDARHDGSFERFTNQRFAYRDRYGRDRYNRDSDGRGRYGWYDDRGRYHRGDDRSDRNGRYGRGDRDDRYDRDRDDRYDRDRDGRSDRGDYGRRVDIRGRIEQADNGCLVLLDRDVDVFALTGDVGRIRDGDRVRVTGELRGPSRCGNQTILVRDLDRY